MKKLLLLIPLVLLNCNKKEEKMKTITNNDSLKSRNENPMDSSNKGVVSVHDAEKESTIATDTFRIIEGDKIIKTLNGDMLPLKISDEFTQEQQQMIIKIKNFKGTKIEGKVTSTNPQLNIRFNQIRMANGEFDGPFGENLNYDIKEKGEIWLIIGKNLMASGENTGKFTVNLK